MREAGEADAAALAELLFASPQAGRTILGQDRAPDPFARRRPYDDTLTLVLDGDDGLDATGTCATKEVLVDGEAVRAAYVFDVAVADRARRRGLAGKVLGRLEDWAGERGSAFLYAHVIAGNEASVGLFRRAGYEVACDLTSRAYPVFRSRTATPGAGAVEDWDAAASVLRDSLGGFDLVRPVSGEGLRRLWTSLPGWRAEDVWTTGRAVLGLWDYRAVARTIPLRLPPEARAIGGLERLARVFRVPFPKAPKLGEPMSYGLLLGGGGVEADLRRLFTAALGRALERGIDIVVFFHDRRERPGWTKAAFSVAETYHLLAKPLGGRGPGGGRVWVDPVDL